MPEQVTGSTHGKLLSLHGGHSIYGDGSGRLDEFVRAAVKQGMVAFGFSEHMPRPEKYWYPGESPEANSWANFQRYLEEVQQVKAAFRGQLEILLGAELELIPGQEDFVSSFLHEFQLDYAVGSVHFVHDVGFDYSVESYHRALKLCGGQECFALDYLDTLESMMDRIPFQVLGHFDLFKVFHQGAFPLTDRMREKIDGLMARIARKSLLLDINARGLLKPCQEIYPGLEILRIARRHNVAVTLGDDSHAPSEVGQNLDGALQHARSAGYTQISFLRSDGSRDRVMF
ncbi:MAG: histidinol-phosphatase [Acidobacteria bacterium]|nr:histidinol-phosphatase [Acidobacteriota bacterium]